MYRVTNLIVLRHARDHQLLDEFTGPQLELVDRVGQGRLHDLLAIAGLLLDLLEEEAVLLGKLRAETLVQHLDDFR